MIENRQQLQNKNTYGFTIIELLIVIVVIGVLAALVLTSYSSIKGRGHNAVTLNTLQQYTKALTAYKVDHDTFPPTPNGEIVCLGTGYSNGCGYNGQGAENEDFNNMMRPYIGNPPNIKPHDTTFSFGAGAYVFIITGMTYHQFDTVRGDTIDGEPATEGQRSIVYALDTPNAKCRGGKVMMNIGEGVFISKDESGNPFRNSATDEKNTGCFVLLQT